MFALLLSRGEPTLARKRPPPDRVVGCCRDATLLFVSLARHKGIPARMRVGFAAYLQPGLLIDHVVAEAWDEAAGRWRLIDGEMSGGWTPEAGGRPVDWLDLAGDQFVTGTRAWQAARAGTSAPERHLTAPELDAPELRGWPLLARHAIHDLAALNKTEMLVWDAWGMQLAIDLGQIAEQDAVLLDQICAQTADPGVSPPSSPPSPTGTSCAFPPPSPASIPTAAPRARSPSARETPDGVTIESMQEDPEPPLTPEKREAHVAELLGRDAAVPSGLFRRRMQDAARWPRRVPADRGASPLLAK